MPAFYFPMTVNDLADYHYHKPKRLSKKFAAKAYSIYEWIYIRSRLSEAQNHRCCWCSRLTTEVRGKKNSSTVEHLTPKSEGGTDDIENLVMACHECNQKRKTYHWELFLLHIEEGIVLPGTKIKVKGPSVTLPTKIKGPAQTPSNIAKVSWYINPLSRNKGLKIRTKLMMKQLEKNPQLVWC